LLFDPVRRAGSAGMPAGRGVRRYSYFRANPEGFKLNEWNGSLARSVTDWFGIEGDFGGHRVPGVDTDRHPLMIGPKLACRTGSITPFAPLPIGAGADVNVSGLVALRVAQADYRGGGTSE